VVHFVLTSASRIGAAAMIERKILMNRNSVAAEAIG
jgi:hypothetical protein